MCIFVKLRYIGGGCIVPYCNDGLETLKGRPRHPNLIIPMPPLLRHHQLRNSRFNALNSPDAGSRNIAGYGTFTDREQAPVLAAGLQKIMPSTRTGCWSGFWFWFELHGVENERTIAYADST
jgi:hypothetical protein